MPPMFRRCYAAAEALPPPLPLQRCRQSHADADAASADAAAAAIALIRFDASSPLFRQISLLRRCCRHAAMPSDVARGRCQAMISPIYFFAMPPAYAYERAAAAARCRACSGLLPVFMPMPIFAAGADDAAASRYVFVELLPLSRHVSCFSRCCADILRFRQMSDTMQ